MNSLLCINTGGIGDLHGLRARRLTKNIEAECTYYDLDKSKSRLSNIKSVWKLLKSRPWDLVYQEGSGISGGLPLIYAARFWNQAFVVSSGDPIGGYFRTVHGPVHGLAFEQYEKMLYRHCAGFVGWTPYLSGVAMKMGAPLAATVEGAVDLSQFTMYPSKKRHALKEHYGLKPDHLVCGVVGSLKWTSRQEYCYGLELIKMLPHIQRDDVSVLIVGSGDGKAFLESQVPPSHKDRVVFTGRVEEEEVVDTLNAMDVGFITQTLDYLGRYRLTTKLPEYLACGLPVAMSPVPGYYDYALRAGWPLPPHHPADPAFHRACASWIDELAWNEIKDRRPVAQDTARQLFAYEVVRPKFEAFINLLFSDLKAK